MDSLTVSAVVAALNQFLSSAAAEAGKGVWGGLVRLVRSRFPEQGEVVRATEALTPGAGVEPAEGAVVDLSAELVGLAKGDPEFAAALRGWLEEARNVSVDTGGNTHNVMSGIARNVVQARDTGPVHLG